MSSFGGADELKQRVLDVNSNSQQNQISENEERKKRGQIINSSCKRQREAGLKMQTECYHMKLNYSGTELPPGSRRCFLLHFLRRLNGKPVVNFFIALSTTL